MSTGLRTEATVCDRLVSLCGSGRLDAQIDLIDTRENADAVLHGYAAGTEQNFSTESVDSDLFSFLDGGDARPLRVVILPQARASHFETSSMHGAGTGQARLDEIVELNVEVHADNPGTFGGVQWFTTGALRRALRVAKGVVALLMMYPRLDVPAPTSLDGIAAWTEVEGIERVDPNPESAENVTIRVPLRVRLTAVRA